MSFLELQNQVIALPVPERVRLMEQLRSSLTVSELEQFYINQAEEVLDAVEAGKMATHTADELRKRRAAIAP
jgi:hypothetical protein